MLLFVVMPLRRVPVIPLLLAVEARMGLRTAGIVAGCWLLAGVAQASETGPVIVVPGHPGVPVLMYGRDISGAIVYSDWGLDRPSQTSPIVIYPYPAYDYSYRYSERYLYPERYYRRYHHRRRVGTVARYRVTVKSPPQPVVQQPAGYFPMTGHKPKVGRKEVDVPRPPQAPESFYRSFGVESDHNPAPAAPPQDYQLPAIVPQPQRHQHP
jgi:hypothetical protein